MDKTQPSVAGVESLTRRTAHGAMWLLGSRAWSQLMSLTIGVVLARQLSPADFGLIGMVTVVTGLFWMFSDMGLSTAVVQKQDLTEAELSSVFWFNVGIASAIAGLLAAASPLVAQFYAQPKVMPVMCALVMMFPVSALSSVQYALVQKAMRFPVATKIQMVSSVTAGLLALGAAFAGLGVWSLVLQMMVAAVVSGAGLWWQTKWHPSFHFAWKDLNRIWGFSLNLTGFQFVNYFARKGDYFLIGKFLGAAQLGYYNLAYTLMVYPISTLTSVVQGALMPAMSQVQHEVHRVANAYVRTCRYLSFAILPMMVGLALVSREAVLTVYGPKWNDAWRVLQILAWVGVFQPFVSLSGSLLVARGFTRWFFWWGIVCSLITLSGFALGLPWGITGVAWSYFITEILITIFGMPILFRKVDVPMGPLLAGMKIPALATVVMGAVVFATKAMLLAQGLAAPALVFAVCVATGAASYALMLLLLKNYFWTDLKAEFARVFGKRPAVSLV